MLETGCPVNIGVGLTLTTYLIGVPLHPPKEGVMVYVTVPVVVPVVEMVCMGNVLVLPESAYPVIPAVAVADHEKVVPGKSAVRFTNVVDVPEQIVCDSVVFVIAGIGFTANVRVAVGEEPHSLPTISDTV